MTIGPEYADTPGENGPPAAPTHYDKVLMSPHPSPLIGGASSDHDPHEIVVLPSGALPATGIGKAAEDTEIDFGRGGIISDTAQVGGQSIISPEAVYSRAQRREYDGTTVLIERHLSDYLNVFGYDEESMRGGIFLDIGSGHNLLFAKEAKKYGIRVVSLNPELGGTGLHSEILRSEGRAPHPAATTWERIQRKIRSSGYWSVFTFQGLIF